MKEGKDPATLLQLILDGLGKRISPAIAERRED